MKKHIQNYPFGAEYGTIDFYTIDIVKAYQISDNVYVGYLVCIWKHLRYKHNYLNHNKHPYTRSIKQS